LNEYGYFKSQFQTPPINICRKMNYYNLDQRNRIQAQIRYEQQQFEEQIFQVSFVFVDVKELEG